MNVPIPPSDNLYKFLAIFGLILALLSFIYPEFLFFELETNRVKLQGEITVLKGNSQAIDTALSKTLTDSEEIKRIDNLAELIGKYKVLEGLLDIYREVTLKFQIGLGLGIFLMIIGFILWYNKVQKYQDQILKSDAEGRNTRSSTQLRRKQRTR